MKVAFLTLGCKVNFYETEKMEADFEANHVTVVPFKEKADVYIVNTCTVTNIADRKSRQMLHRARRLNPESIVVATGCYAESGKAQLEDDDTIDVVFANRDKASIASQVLDYVKEHRRSEILIRDVEQLNQKYRKYFIGKEVTVLFEEIQKIDGISYLTGHNERYVRFGVPAETTKYEENQMVTFVAEKENIL